MFLQLDCNHKHTIKIINCTKKGKYKPHQKKSQKPNAVRLAEGIYEVMIRMLLKSKSFDFIFTLLFARSKKI